MQLLIKKRNRKLLNQSIITPVRNVNNAPIRKSSLADDSEMLRIAKIKGENKYLSSPTKV